MPETLNLKEIGLDYNRLKSAIKKRVVVCAGTGCVANGSLEVFDALQKSLKNNGLDVILELKKEEPGTFLTKSGCQGFCQMGPLVTIFPEGILYTKVKPADAEEIVAATIKEDRLIERLVYSNPSSGDKTALISEIPFYKKQHRYVLKSCGVIDPEDIREYIADNGYSSAENAAFNMSPESVCKEISASGLRGRGGAGFLTGRKWDMARVQKNSKKYIVCNGDEGDPGAFMDRSVMEGNPHSVIEGMIIAGLATGADEGIVYVRTEYPLAVKRMRKAVSDAFALNILGNNIFSSGKSFSVSVMEGAGAFVCGEETALLASVQGERGMPAPKPPFPAQSGLWGKPTVINNVETLATVPLILRHGTAEYRKMGTEKTPGTKTFALTGHVANTGLIEVPFGTTLRHLLNEVAGGVTGEDGSVSLEAFKAVQIGGPSGACLTSEHMDLPLDFDSLKSIGAMVGSGGLVVMNKSTCMVAISRFFMQFTQNESCGKCVPCREGTKQMLNLLDDILEGRADDNTLPLLEELAVAVQRGSLCGLGKSAPNPVLSTLKYFRREYTAHIKEHRCPSGSCKAFIQYSIDPALCKGCMLCAKKCPSGAITGELKKPHKINSAACTKCGICVTSCKFKAVKGAA